MLLSVILFAFATPDKLFGLILRYQSVAFGSDIFIYKRGNEYGAGLEPYCEMLASEIAAIISPENYVPYQTVLLHDKLTSKCNLFTNE